MATFSSLSPEDLTQANKVLEIMKENGLPDDDQRVVSLREIIAQSNGKEKLNEQRLHRLRAQELAYHAITSDNPPSGVVALALSDLCSRKPRIISPIEGYHPGITRRAELEAISQIASRRAEIEREQRIQSLNDYADQSDEDLLTIKRDIMALEAAEAQQNARESFLRFAYSISDARAFDWRIHRRTRHRHTQKQREDLKRSGEKLRFDQRRVFLRLLKSRYANFTDHYSGMRAIRHRINRELLAYHVNKAKLEKKRKEMEERDRLRALRENDEDAYFALLEKSKDQRLFQLLSKTSECLEKLGAQLKHMGGDETAVATTAKPDDDVRGNYRRIDREYYTIAHRISERVITQPSGLVGEMKSYQIEGLQWLVSLYNNNLNGILADEMGLGKTIQTIGLLQHLLEYKKNRGPHLVIVPLSTVHSWVSEFQRWAPSVDILLYNGPPDTRRELARDVQNMKFNVVVTTAEYTMRDEKLLKKVKWEYIVIDEGHRIKNRNCKLATSLTAHYQSKHRLILTGTPLQNNIRELWSLLNFILPSLFESIDSFEGWFNAPFSTSSASDRPELNEEESLLVIRRLHQVLRPFLLRREKKDVEKDLPDRIEIIIKCELSAWQTGLHEMVKNTKVKVMSNNVGVSSVSRVHNVIMELRKVCQHPYLHGRVFDSVMHSPDFQVTDEIWRASGKFELLDRILPKMMSTGHKILIFTQFKMVLDLLNMYLEYRHVKHLYLDGSTASSDRQNLLEIWSENADFKVFLLTTRAGGVGLNLQSADTVILFDSDWNPQMDLQAQSRAHRIGQTSEVRVYRLVAVSPVEQMMYDRAQFKLEMGRKVIDAGAYRQEAHDEDREMLLRSIMEYDYKRASQLQVPDAAEVNRQIARSDQEYELFQEMDRKQGKSNRAPLMTEDELPDEFLADLEVIKEDADEMRQAKLLLNYGRGRRQRQDVSYRDIGDRQFNKLLRDGATADGGDSVPLIGARAMHRRVRRKVTQSTSSESESSSSLDYDDSSSSDEEKDLPGMSHSALTRLAKVLQEMRHTVDDEGVSICSIFEDLPDPQQFPDYYEVIGNPISLKSIQSKLSNRQYQTFAQFKEDFMELFSNAKYYNGDDSLVYKNAVKLETKFEEVWEREIDDRSRVIVFKLLGK